MSGLRLLWILLALPALAAANSVTVDRWGVDDGLPNHALTGIIQTSDGYLWVASWARIVRFDGVRFTPIATDLPNVRARTLLEHPDGSIWIGATGWGLVRWRPGGSDSFTPASGLAGSDVRALALDDRGRVWAATEGGVSLVGAEGIQTVGASDGLPDASVLAITPGAGSRMWVTTAAGVCSIARDSARCEPLARQPARPAIALETSDGGLWIGGAAGLHQVRGRPGHAPACRDGCLAGLDVTTMIEGRDGGLWIGLGWSGGIVRVDGERIIRYGAEAGVPELPVIALFEDDEGSVWATLDGGGLVRLRPHRVTAYTTADGLPARVVTSIVQDTAGRLWAGTACGPVAELVGGRFVPRFAEHIGQACSRSVLAARDGTLWIGTDSIGLLRWDGRRMRRFDRAAGLSDDAVSALFEDRDGVIWIATPRGDVHRFADGQLSRGYGAADGAATGYVVTFAQDRTGRVWIGSNANGLFVYENGRFEALGRHDGLPTGNVSALIVDHLGDLWIGTAAHGLFRRRSGHDGAPAGLQTGRYDRFGPDQGLGDVLVALLVEDRDGHIWVSTTRGIVRLDRARIDAVAAGRAATLDPVAIGRRDGVPHSEGSGGGFDPSGLRDRDGRLWFSTLDGIAMVDPATFRINRRPPPLAIEAVTAGGEPAPRAAADVTIPPGTSAIEIAYTAFSLLDPARVRFKYRLAGLDDEWTDAGDRRVAYYSHLPPATYTFEVLAANNDGIWSTEAASVRLVVMPFWWERGVVRGGGLLALLAATGIAARAVATRRARARLLDLERAHALQRERERIARDLHDELGARLTRIALLADPGQRHGDPARLTHATRDAIATMGELVWSVNARHDTVESFANYAAEFAQDHLEAAGLRFRLDISPDLGTHVLSADARRHLYLAFKEAVNNAVKHAHASQVRVTIGFDAGVFVVGVADDGRGLPVGGEGTRLDGSTGNGFDNMRERMRAVRGTMTVDTPEGGGTRLTFRLPLG